MFSTADIAALSGGIRPPAPKNYRLPEHFPSLRKAKRIALDLEGVDPSISADMGPGWRREAWICGFSLSIGDIKTGRPEFSEYYPIRHKDGPNLNPDTVFDWLKDELAFYDGELTGANLLYDADGFQYQGIMAPFAKWRDVQWAEALIDENAFNYQLERLSNKYKLGGKLTDELKALYGPGYKERMHEVHPGHMKTYGIGDTEQPLQILHEQYKELKSQNLTDVFHLECRLLPILLYMRRIGQPVDMKHADSLHATFTQKRNEALAVATQSLGLRGFVLNPDNFGKPAVLKQALDHLGLVYPRTEKKGMPSVTDEWLAAQEHPFGPAVALANQYDKALGTFVNGYVTNFAIKGRVHCEFHPLRSVNGKGKSNGTVAGRFSSGNPNLQNIPVRHDVIGPLCRAMFVPEPDMDYFSGDYSQIEYREIVHAAVLRAQMPKENAEKMWGKKNGLDIWNRLQSAFVTRDAYINDPSTDFHAFMAKLTGLERKYAKSVNFAIAFVMGLQSFAEGLGWVTEDGKPNQKSIDTLETYHKAVPFVKAVGSAFTWEAQELGYTESLLGRRAHYDRWEPKYREDGVRAKPLPYEQALIEYGPKLKRCMTHAALNRYTQMGGADMMKTAMVQVWEAGLLDDPSELVVSLTVHDELDGSVGRTKRANEKLAELQHIMQNAILLTVPTTTEFKRGQNWAETH